MRKKLFYPILILILFISLPYHTFARRISHKNFIAFILSKAAVANAEIMQQRKQLLRYYYHFHTDPTVVRKHSKWLIQLAKDYDSPYFNFNRTRAWTSLLKRVDVVPNSLVVAQAINESAWGTSRFAKQGNNFYGEWCFTKGCGLVPTGRAKGAKFEVRKFPNALASVKSYMHNLNSNEPYSLFRTQRHLLRVAGEPLYGLNLVNALTMYSTKRQKYVEMITDVIKKYHLADYDMVNGANKHKSHFFDWF
jgi:Bax protein